MAEEEQRVFNARYELHRRIARGGMADVFLARDALLDRPVAVKVLFPEFATDPTFVQRFRREAQAAANLSHPNIVSVYDWGEEGGTYFIVMEYIEGRSLAQIIKDEGRLHPDRAADITADAAAALGFAHRNGVVHRDVKPGNVIISPSGQVNVADFGIARAVSNQENLTQAGTVMGTATYFSPEQARGESVDPRSDVYSLGVVLYEMLTGGPPFTGDSPVAVAYKHVQETPQPPRSRNRDIPPELEAVVLKAMAKDTADRYASAEDLRADLRRFREGSQVTAAVAAPLAAAGTATRAIGVTPAADVGATRAIPVAEETRTIRREEDLYHDEPPRRQNTTFIVVLVVLLAILAALLFWLASNLGLGGDTAEVEVPPLEGLTEVQARAALEEADLAVGTVTTEENPGALPGVVLRSDPPPGEMVEEDTAVDLVVNAAPELVAVPEIEGLSELDARGRLEARKLVPQFQREESSEVDEGDVISSQPAAGEEVPAGSTVVVQVSSGPPLVVVPSVVGSPQDVALNVLIDAGFRPQVRQEAANQAAGTVIRTEPGAGTQAPEDSTVTVIVSTGPATTTTTTTTTTTPPVTITIPTPTTSSSSTSTTNSN